MRAKYQAIRPRLWALLLAGALVAPRAAGAAQTTITGAGAIAPTLVFANPVNLDFGELVIQTAGTAGSLTLNPATGASALVNATQLGTATRGSIDLTGRRGVAVVFTAAAGTPACDTAYLGACTGTPTFSITHSFTGQISAANCPGGGIRCTDRVYVGGAFAFAGTEEGRWTTTVTLTANYQ